MENFNLNNESKMKSGFKTPENYFENFESKILTTILEQKTESKPKVISIFSKKKMLISSIAAVFAISVGFYFYNKNNLNNETLIHNNFASENYSAEEIAILLTENDLLELEKSILNINQIDSEYIQNNIY